MSVLNLLWFAASAVSGLADLPATTGLTGGETIDAPARPALQRAVDARFQIQGVFGNYLSAVTREWLLAMPTANPAVLDMFRDRDKKPPRDLLPWSGEFAGKYLTGAVQVHRLTQDPILKNAIQTFVARLVKLQADDGYLGPFAPDNRLEGKNGTWDAWGHYHIMLGLILWHQDTGSPEALGCAKRIADLLCVKFLDGKRSLTDTGSSEMNHAVIHGLGLLYQITKEPKYRSLALRIADVEFADPRAGDYLRIALAGKEFFQGPKPRWESLHPIQGLAVLYEITGKEDYRKAFERLWWSIAKLDRHNNGGFSSGEQAQGNPYHAGAIETCCTVAWIAMSVDMLRLTGNSIVADELELSTMNQVLGYQDHSGKYCTYNTPMNGSRRKSTDEIGFQIRPGSEQVNCCSANAPRGFGMISDWALMTDGAGLTVNWYGPSTLSARVKNTRVTLVQKTEYPQSGRISITVNPEPDAQTDAAFAFPLRIRIPHWSARTTVQVNGKDAASAIRPGHYLTLDRGWKRGDTVDIDLDMSLHYWVGERESAGKSAVFTGPVLLVREIGQAAMTLSPQWKHFGELSAVNTVGEYVEIPFEGTTLVWSGKRFDDAGIVQVKIDGEPVAEVDQYGPGRELPFVWRKDGLKPGRHTARLTLIAKKNPASKGQWINFTGLGPDADASFTFDAETLHPRWADADAYASAARPALVIMEVNTVEGPKVRLRDYGTAGAGGVPYVSWLPVRHVKPTPFSPENPLRSGRVGK